jgi:hypothetical protein
MGKRKEPQRNYSFGQVVVLEEGQIGVVVKCWADDTYEVYIRELNTVSNYRYNEIRPYIYSKTLAPDEFGYYDWG